MMTYFMFLPINRASVYIVKSVERLIFKFLISLKFLISFIIRPSLQLTTMPKSKSVCYMVDIITKYICLSIEQFEATLILSLNNRFDQLSYLCSFYFFKTIKKPTHKCDTNLYFGIRSSKYTFS